ncbi:MAG: fungal specific transcription factor domain-containing protein, partial [Staphylococcus equorum]|nr:fungal specific transcription factor domain-containing protein [Staphylococcus equorum]
MDDDDNEKNKVITDGEAAGILNTLYGSSSQIDNSTRQKHDPTKLEVKGLAIKQVHFTKEECDQIIKNIQHQNRMAYDTFIVTPEFRLLYLQAFSPYPPKPSASWLYLYCTLGIGSIIHPVSSLNQLPERVQALYLSCTSLVGQTIIESSPTSAVALSAYSHFCMLIGDFLSQGKFGKLALSIFFALGYQHDKTFSNMNEEERESRVRIFWHVYTVGFFHSAFFTDTRDILDIRLITTPYPVKRTKSTRFLDQDDSFTRDNDYKYQNIKLKLINAWAKYYDNDLIKYHKISIDLFNEIKSIVEYQGVSNQDRPALEMYSIVTQSIIIHMMACAHKKQNNINIEALKIFVHTAYEYIDEIYDYTMKKIYLGASWYVIHHVF